VLQESLAIVDPSERVLGLRPLELCLGYGGQLQRFVEALRFGIHPRQVIGGYIGTFGIACGICVFLVDRGDLFIISSCSRYHRQTTRDADIIIDIADLEVVLGQLDIVTVL